MQSLVYPEQLIGWRDALLKARFSGVREVRDSNGEMVRYATDREMGDAIAALDREIVARGGARSPKTIRFLTNKGL